MKRTLAVSLVCLLMTFLLPSCGTFTTWDSQFEKDQLHGESCMPRVYSGFIWDLNVMDPSTGVGQPDDEREEPYFNLLYVFDLPFSLVADTLMLPFSVYDQVMYGSFCAGERPK